MLLFTAGALIFLTFSLQRFRHSPLDIQGGGGGWGGGGGGGGGKDLYRIEKNNRALKFFEKKI